MNLNLKIAARSNIYMRIAAVLVIMQVAVGSVVYGQCQGFFVTVETDPPYLMYCPGDTILGIPVISGGTPPFTYSWSSGGTDSIEALVALETGWYSACVTVTDANGCVAIDCQHVKPTYYNLNIWSSGIECEGESVQLTVSVPDQPNEFLWSNGETTNPIFVTEPGVYTVTITDPALGCAEVLEITAEFYALPTPEISGPMHVCNGLTAELEVVDPGQYNNFIWSSGENTPLIEISESGTYSVTVTDSHGCTGTAEYVVEHLFGTFPEISAPEYLCAEDVGEIEVTNAGELLDFVWSTGETTSSIDGTAPGTYSVTVTDLNGCIETGEVAVQLFEVTDPALSGEGDICFEQETVVIAVEQSYVEYLWSNGETTQEITVIDPGVYGVTVTDENGCTTTGEHEIIAAPIPEPYIQLPPITCDSTPALLQVLGSGGPYVEFLWTPTGETSAEIVAFETGTFSVWVANAFGCTGTSFEETVVIGNGPTAEISVTPENCNESAILTASGEGYYAWSTGETTESITVTDGGAYGLTVSDDNGCTATASVIISVSGELEVEITGPPALCVGGMATLGVNANFDNYAWSTGETSAEISVSEPGTYLVTVMDDSGCSGIDSTTITQVTSPAPEIMGMPGFCGGDSSVLALTDTFSTILWSTGETSNTISVNTSGTYSVEVTNTLGCIGSDTFSVTLIPEPDVEITGPSTLCIGGSATISISGAYETILWSTGDTAATIEILGSGLFEVTVTDNNGCTSTDSHVVEIGDSIVPEISMIIPACGDTATLDAGDGYASYVWSDGATSSSIIVTENGTYSVTVSDQGGCSGVAVAEPVLPELPEVEISGPSSGCESEGVLLICSSGFSTYTWSSGETSDSITVFASGSYSVVVTDTNGCSASASIAVEVFAQPDVSINGPASICTSTDTILSVSDSYTSILWSTGEVTPTIVVSGSGTFTVTVQDSNGCIAADDHILVAADSLSPVITPIGPICGGEVTLDAGSGYYSYVWSDGSTTPTITVSTSGTYSVTVNDQGGCSGIDVINITVPTPTQVTITGPGSTCSGNPETLTADTGFASYLWSTGDTTESIVVDTAGTYRVEVTDMNGCPSSASHVFDVIPSPDFIISGPQFLCAGDSAALFINDAYPQILWSTGSTSDVINVTSGGIYTVEVVDANGCTATSQFQITQHQTDFTFIEIETCSVLDTGIIEHIETNQFGCDSIISVHALLAPSLTTEITMTACPGQEVTYDGVNITAGTSYQFIHVADNGCDSIVMVHVDALPPVVFETFVEGTCANTTQGIIEIQIHDGATPCFFALNGGALGSSQAFTNLPSGNHVLLIQDANGCVIEEVLEIPDFDTVVVAVADGELSCDNRSVELAPEIITGNVDQVMWLWSNGSTESSILVDAPGRYSVVVDDGCAAKEYEMTVNWSHTSEGETYFFVPNVFSPNGDGINEILRTYPSPDLTILDFEFGIFDRWGTRLFGADDTEKGWDGIFGSELMQPGVYVWYIKAKVDVCGTGTSDILEKGDVTIVR